MKALILWMTGLLLLSSCSGQKLDSYRNESPKLDLHQFFDGDLVAHGIVQNRGGKVLQRFRADIKASWNGPVATLDEKFSYADGKESTRVWTLREKPNNKYIGTASDVVGEAHGEVVGNTFYFEYVLDIEVDGTTYAVTFEDWMYLLDEKTLLARSYMTKFGFDVGEVTLVMLKKE